MFRCFGDCDVIERIPDGRLKELEKADPSWVIDHLRANTVFDADKLHLMLDLAKEYVQKEIEARRTGKNTQ